VRYEWGKEKRDGNTEVTEDTENGEEKRKEKGKQKIEKRKEIREKKKEEPKTQAQTPCLGHPARGRRHGEEKNKEVKRFVFLGRRGD
jgi:hypothetical protein